MYMCVCVFTRVRASTSLNIGIHTPTCPPSHTQNRANDSDVYIYLHSFSTVNI